MIFAAHVVVVGFALWLIIRLAWQLDTERTLRELAEDERDRERQTAVNAVRAAGLLQARLRRWEPSSS